MKKFRIRRNRDLLGCYFIQRKVWIFWFKIPNETFTFIHQAENRIKNLVNINH